MTFEDVKTSLKATFLPGTFTLASVLSWCFVLLLLVITVLMILDATGTVDVFSFIGSKDSGPK